MKLWLDDVRPAPEGWTWAKTVERAQDWLILAGSDCSEASLDHDLGFEGAVIPPESGGDPEKWFEYMEGRTPLSDSTGYDLVRWMIENDYVPPIVRIHSWNPDGARRMAAALAAAGHPCAVRPFVLDLG